MAKERLERLAALRREGILTDAEYETRRAALIDEAIDAPGTQPSPRGRNSGHVIWGFIFGVPFGLVAVAFLLSMPRGKKREDALFGAWFGTVVGAIVVAVTVAAIVTTTGGGEPTRAAAPQAPTAVPSLLTASEAERIVRDDFRTRSLVEGASWRLCDEARYRSADRTWVITCKFSTERAGPVVDTETYLLDDRTGKKIR